MKKSIGIFCLILLALLVAPTAAATLYVDDDGGDGVYTTISEALGAVTEGDTIFVRAGTYPAFYSITVPNLTIKGEGAACVTVDSTGNSLNIGEQGAGTTFEGLRILKAGQVATYGSDCIIRDCVFDGLTGSATILIRAPNCTFANNSVQNLLSPTTNTGVNVYSASARIVNNTFVNIPVTTSALYIRKESTNATIEDNLFENCTGSRPLTLREVTGCTVANNTFKNTHNEAIRLWKTTATDNVITGNSFGGTAICFYDTGDGNRFYLNNNISGAVLYTDSTAPTTTYWNATTPVTYTYKGTEYTGYPGNFWSNYTGDDTDGDGIIDTSYVLPDGLGTDHAPLAGAWKDGSIAAPVQEPATLYVDDDGGDGVYTTIQAAHDAASPGDTICILPGTYSRFIVEIPHLTIQSRDGADSVIVDCQEGEGPRIPDAENWNATGTILDGLTFLNGKPSFQLGTYGPANDSIVRNCILKEMVGGNLVPKGDNITLENNTFMDATATLTCAVMLRDSTNCKITNNTFTNITTGLGAIFIYKTTAINNTIAENTFNDINGNTFYFRDAGENNRFYLNTNASGVALHTGTAAPTTTYWNATTPVTYTYKGTEYTGYPGNFWSNYTGDDTDGDGIIDTPYVLPDGLGTDHAPLAGAWKDGSIAAPVQEPTTWYVDDDGGADFTTISDAVSASTVGDTIVVKDGAYTENVLVDKLLVIRTENGSDAVTVTAAAPDKPVFDVDADGATVEGFAVRGPTNEHIAGIEIVGFNNCVVTGNDCAGCYNGIHLGGTAANNTVEKNSCHENTRRGISLRDTAHDNLIYNNTCENNADDEICAKDQAADNIIWANTFDGTVELATANTYHSPAEVAYTYRGTAYTGYVGNHYSLYTGADTNGDGIGDTPMSFGTYADDYPMMGSWQDGIITYTTPSIARIALSPDSAALVLGETQQFDATAYDVADAPVVETVFVWASSNTSVGTVNATGFFETLAVGTTDVTATAGSITGAATVTVAAATAAIEWAPYVTGTTTTTATIHWRTDLPSNGSVEYADETYYAANGGYEHTIDDPSVTDLHHVDLAGLAPGTRYHYHVVAEGTATGDRTFSTFPESGEFTFIVYGDTQESQSFTQLERHSLVAERIAAEEPLFVLHLGDTVNMVDDAAEWERFFEAGDPVFANTSFFPALGNHEENSSAYYDAFGMPEWYSFDCAGAHVAVLDSNTWIGDRMDDETAWLEADLAGEDDWKFVAFHHPPYTSEGRNPGGNIYLREEWGPVIANESVSAVFSGHVHAYERYLVDGVNYVVTGTGGGPLYPLSTERPDGYQNSLEHTLGYTKVIVHENGSATMEFVEVALVSDDNNEVLEIYPDGMSFDAFTLTVPEALPDLAVTSLEVPASASTGTTYTVTATVENTGDAAAPGTAVALTVDGTEVGRKEISALGPGGSATVAFAWTPSASGTMEVAVQVDPDCTVTDANRANNLRSGSVAVEGGSIGPSINDTIVLSRGWNFVSTPRRLSAGNDTAEIFLSVDMAGRPLYAYDAATETWLQMNPSSQVRPLQGYWVYADQDASVPLSFNEDPLQAPPETTLSRGWNAIGFSDTIPAPARDTLSSVGDAWTTLIGYDAGAGVYETSMINGATGLHSDMGEMKPMQGYWLYMTGSGTLCAISA